MISLSVVYPCNKIFKSARCLFKKQKKDVGVGRVCESRRQHVCVCVLLQADGVRAPGGVVNGGAYRLGHSPFIPDLLSIVTPPKAHAHVIATGQRDRLLHEDRKKKVLGLHSRHDCSLQRINCGADKLSRFHSA